MWAWSFGLAGSPRPQRHGRVNLATITALPSFEVVRWEAFPARVGGIDLSIRAQRWTVPGGSDFLELSIVSDVDRGGGAPGGAGRVRHGTVLGHGVGRRGVSVWSTREHRH
jgi:hypothetical protein